MWDDALRGPWRERGTDDRHRHSDPVGPYLPLSGWNPAVWPSLLHEESRPPVGPPSE